MNTPISILIIAVIFTAFAYTAEDIPAYSPDEYTYGPAAPFIPAGGETDVVTWTQMADCTPARRAACGQIGNYWYMFGGLSVCTAQAFNLTTNSWSPWTPPPFGYCNAGGVAAGGSIYLVGSFTTVYGDHVQRFTPREGGPSGTWVQMTPYPHSACGIAVAWDGGGHIYASGGGALENLSTAYVYSIASNSWTQIADMPQALKYQGGAFCGGRFHVVGGIVQPSNQHFAYDPASNTWSTYPSLPVPVGFPLFATSNDNSGTNIYIVGGGGGYASWPTTDAVQVYNWVTNSWTLETPWPMANVGLNSAGYVNSALMAAGGAIGGTTDVHDVYKGDLTAGGMTAEIDLTYISGAPIPAGGGVLNFNIEVTPIGQPDFPVDIWTMAFLPNGSTYGPLIFLDNYELSPMGPVNRNRSQVVPASAPAGNYVYRAYVGEYPDNFWSMDFFNFVKSPVDNASPTFSGWECFGESFAEAKDNLTPVYSSLILAYPNPFNSSTRIAFTMPEIANASMTIYDVNGREAAKLFDGYLNEGNHSIGFDGSSLPSGVYFAVLKTDEFTAVQKLLLVK